MRGKMFRESFVFLYFILFLGKGLQFIGQAWLNYLAYSVLFILGILAYQKKLVEQFHIIFAHKKTFLKTLSLYMVLLFILTLVFNFLAMWLKSSLGLSLQGQNNANIQKSLAESPFLVLIFGCFIGPFVEELFFRRILLGTFFAQLPSFVGLVLTTLLFATLHMHSFSLAEWLTAISYIGAGLVFSLLYLKKDKNIWYPLVLHSCNNLIAFIIMSFLT